VIIRRTQSLSGVVGVGLLGAALVLPGQPPKASDSAAALRATLVAHHGAFVGGTLLAALGAVALLWFVSCIATTLRKSEAPDNPNSTVALTAGLAAILLLFVGMVLFSGAAFNAAEMCDHAVVRAAVDTGSMLIEASKFAFAALIVVTCFGVAFDHLPQGLVQAGRLSAALLVLSAFPPFLTDHGVGQFNGPIDLLGAVPAYVWLGALSVALARIEWAQHPSLEVEVNA
jgi:hypothetical protein